MTGATTQLVMSWGDWFVLLFPIIGFMALNGFVTAKFAEELINSFWLGFVLGFLFNVIGLLVVLAIRVLGGPGIGSRKKKATRLSHLPAYSAIGSSPEDLPVMQPDDHLGYQR